jgi:hypothetical protein
MEKIKWFRVYLDREQTMKDGVELARTGKVKGEKYDGLLM